tara:strand:- start:1327 stop:1521 length:195 start_codon:yes stop_codon:yes gene_type:complete
MVIINKDGETVMDKLPPCCIDNCEEDARFMIRKDFYCGVHFQKYYELLEEAQIQQAERFKELMK